MSTSTKAPEGLDEREIKLVANALRRDIIDMLEKSKSGHPGGSLSAADLMATLYFSGVLDYNREDPTDHSGDRFFLSKGHCAPVLYAVYHQLGWIEDEDILTLRQLGSKLQGHPDCHALAGIEVCSGSLGQGLAIASGVALGLKMNGSAASSARAVAACSALGATPCQPHWSSMKLTPLPLMVSITMACGAPLAALAAVSAP